MTSAEVIRKARGKMSRSKFAKLLRTTPLSVWHWEKGSRNPRGTVLVALKLYQTCLRVLALSHDPEVEKVLMDALAELQKQEY